MALMALRRQSPPALTAAAMSHAYPYAMGTAATGSASALSSSSDTGRHHFLATSASARASASASTTGTNGLPTVYKFRSDVMSPDPTSLCQQHRQLRFKSAVVDHPDHDDDHNCSSPPVTGGNSSAGGFDADFFKKIMNSNRNAYDNIARHAIDVLRGHVHDREAGNQLQILDLASGPGEPAASLANAFPEANIYATDINPAMVMAAQERLAGRSGVNVKVADMECLSDFDDATFDLVTCSYGLMFADDPGLALYEIHRVLKPGGTLIATVWENLTLERAAITLLRAACDGNPVLPERILDPVSLAGPRHLESLIEKAGMNMITVDQGEYPFELSGDGDTSDAFRLTAMPIYPNLVHLVDSGLYPHAMERAKAAFDDIVCKEDWLTVDDKGGLKTKPNRYKLAVARRKWEDNDGKGHKIVRRSKPEANLYSRPTRAIHVTPETASQAFDQVLTDAYTRINNGPWHETVKAVEHVLHGRDESKAKILNLGSGVGEPGTSLSNRFPKASVVASDSTHDLSSFKDGSFDVVTCAFGLSLLENPEEAMRQIHRVLKPGGSLVIAVWDSLSIEHMSDEIIKAVMKDKPIPARTIDYLSFARPHALERLIEGNNMAIVKMDHEEFPFQLSGLDHQPPDFAFNVATIPIHQNLLDLQKSGENPRALQEAQEAFKTLVDEAVLLHKDTKGHVFTGPNRFKLAIARRQFEDADGVLDK